MLGVVFDYPFSSLSHIPPGECAIIHPFYPLGIFWFLANTSIVAVNILGCPFVNTGVHCTGGSQDRE